MDERKDIKEGVASELTKFFCKTGVFLKKGRAGLVHYSKLLTIKSDISLLKSDKRVIYRKLGEEAYKAIKEGKIDLPESKVTIDRIDRLENSIKEKTDEIERLGQEGHSLKREKEIVKIKEEVEIKEEKEGKVLEKPSVSMKITTPENEKKDVSEKLEQEESSLNVEKKTKEEIEIKGKKEEKPQKKPSKTVRKATSGEKKKTRKTTKEKTEKKISPKPPAVAKKGSPEVKKKAGKTTVKRTVKKKEIKKEDKKS